MSGKVVWYLCGVICDFEEKDVEWIKEIEVIINYDVKVVEYFIKECMVEYEEF